MENSILLSIQLGSKVTREVANLVRELTALTAGNGSHSWNMGVVENETLLWTSSQRKGHNGLLYATETLSLSKAQLNSKTIRGIVVKDHWDDDTGGEVTIKEGGIGCQSVTFEICSRWARGYQFTILVFGS